MRVSKWPGRRKKPFYVKYRQPDGRQKYPAFTSHREARAWLEEHGPGIRAARAREPLPPPPNMVGSEIRALADAVKDLADAVKTERRIAALERRLEVLEERRN